MLFLRAKEDFVSYTPRDKESLHENLRDPGPGVKAENLELAIRKEVRACEWRPDESTSPSWPQIAEPRLQPAAQFSRHAPETIPGVQSLLTLPSFCALLG